VEGQLLKHCVPGSTPLYMRHSSSEHGSSAHVTVMTRVEDVALQHYSDFGYSHGMTTDLLQL